MLLNELLKAIQPVQVTGDSRIEITGVNIDSRLVEAGHGNGLPSAPSVPIAGGIHAMDATAIAPQSMAPAVLLRERLPETQGQNQPAETPAARL